ncbi:MAG: hypothetical protein ACP5VR_03330 [Acidimicrobiales bacterium]
MASCQATKPIGKKRWQLVPQDAHEWVSFKSQAGQHTWRFDVTFLLSNWRCIYGRGCQGTLTTKAPELAEGCCSYGAHFSDEADRQRVEAAARALAPEQWQFAPEGLRRGVARRGPGSAGMTRIVKGACIFLNRPGFPGGPGCALHRAAVETGLAPMELKPDVCWQMPLRREDTTGPDGAVTSKLTQWDREHWGTGGAQFAWWCTEAPEAFTGRQPVWRSLKAELVAMTGPSVYEQLRRYLQAREKAGPVLPHPAVRAKTKLALDRARP